MNRSASLLYHNRHYLSKQANGRELTRRAACEVKPNTNQNATNTTQASRKVSIARSGAATCWAAPSAHCGPTCLAAPFANQSDLRPATPFHHLPDSQTTGPPPRPRHTDPTRSTPHGLHPPRPPLAAPRPLQHPSRFNRFASQLRPLLPYLPPARPLNLRANPNLCLIPAPLRPPNRGVTGSPTLAIRLTLIIANLCPKRAAFPRRRRVRLTRGWAHYFSVASTRI